MAVGGAADAGNSSRGGSTGSSSKSDKAESYSKADRQAKANDNRADKKSEQKSANGQNGREATVEEQNRSLRDFDNVQGRPALGDRQLSENTSLQAKNGTGGQLRSDADMRARVEAYQKDFDHTIDKKIADIDQEIAGIDRRLDGDMFGKTAEVTGPAAKARKEELLQQRANLQKLADSPNAERQAQFETYQRHFDQTVHAKIESVDQEIAEIDRQLKNGPPGVGSLRIGQGLNHKKQQLLQERANLQKLAADPDAALKTLKAEQARANGELSGSDKLHHTLDALGFTPIGDLADALNAVIYAFEGRPKEAAESAFGAVTGPFGNIITGVRKATQAADGLGKGGKAVDSTDKGPDASSGKTVDGTEIAASGRKQLIDEIANNGGKINAEDVIDIRKMPDGKIVWLETGSNTAGQQHILRHAGDFEKRGIPESQIPDALFEALESENVIGYQGKGKGRPIYEFDFNGQTQRIAITVGDNGFIVGANPAK